MVSDSEIRETIRGMLADIGLTDELRAWADQGIARYNAAVDRAVAAGMDREEAKKAHTDVLFTTWPRAALIMTARLAEIMDEPGEAQ
jgi:hypothetical protein